MDMLRSNIIETCIIATYAGYDRNIFLKKVSL